MNASTHNENKPIASYLKRYMEAAAGKKQADEQPAEARARELGECKVSAACDTGGNKELGSTTVAFARDVANDDAVVESNVTATKATVPPPPPPKVETTTTTDPPLSKLALFLKQIEEAEAVARALIEATPTDDAPPVDPRFSKLAIFLREIEEAEALARALVKDTWMSFEEQCRARCYSHLAAWVAAFPAEKARLN